MNEIVKKFLLTEDKFIAELHLRQLGLTCCLCGLLTKQDERIPKLKKQEI